MTLKQLSQLYYLGVEIEDLIVRRNRAAARGTSCTANISPIRGGGGSSSAVELAAVACTDIDNRIDSLLHRIQIEKRELDIYINSIPDSLTRQIFRARFVDGKTWNEVADKVGGNNNEYTVKQICYRYIKNEGR